MTRSDSTTQPASRQAQGQPPSPSVLAGSTSTLARRAPPCGTGDSIPAPTAHHARRDPARWPAAGSGPGRGPLRCALASALLLALACAARGDEIRLVGPPGNADPALARARARMSEALSAHDTLLDSRWPDDLGAGPTVAWGVLDDSPLGRRLSGRLEQADALQPDGFAFQFQQIRAQPTLLVVGRDVRGAIYGAHELARLLRLGRWKPVEPLHAVHNPAFRFRLCSLHDNPGEERFDTVFRDPATILDLGFNGMIIHGTVGLCTFDEVDPAFYPQGSQERARVLADRARVAELVRRAKQNHLMVLLNGDELALPFRVLERGDAVEARAGRDGSRRAISAAKPEVHALLKATFDELFEHFPEVDGVQIRTGEVYVQSEPTLVGNNPTAGTCELSEDWSAEDKLRAVVRTIRRVVVDQHGKRYNQRAWGYYDSWHSTPERYREITDPLRPDPLLTFSFKQTRTDYWRHNAINPNFGPGRHGQWAEFQMAREYEGKGAFPSYLGRYLAEGGPESAPAGGLRALHQRGVRGAWCWARGGGWGGPLLQREDWVALNVYAFSRLLWDPTRDPFELAREWCVLALGTAPGSKALDQFVRVQRLSEQAVLQARYIAAFAERGHLKRGSGWTPCGNWSRDDQLGAGEDTPPAKAFYRFLSKDGTVQRAIDEKLAALAAWDELMVAFEAILESEGQGGAWGELYNTARYGQTWMQTVCHHFAGAWQAFLWRDGGRTDDALRTSALEHLQQADRAWRSHSAEVPQLAGVATPYLDAGLVAERQAVRALLHGR